MVDSNQAWWKQACNPVTQAEKRIITARFIWATGRGQGQTLPSNRKQWARKKTALRWNICLAYMGLGFMFSVHIR